MKTAQISSRLISLWNQVPVLIRAIVTGFLVSTVGVATWVIAFNYIPSPWWILPMLAALALYWKIFSGPGAYRTANFRLVKLTPNVWKWGIAGALLFVVIVQSGFVLTFRFMHVPAQFTSEYKIIETMPGWIAWVTIIMASLVAGICEEAGYRGYMQVQLEKRYGPAIAIVIVSIIFVLIHLAKAWAAPIVPIIFFASVLLGWLAYRTRSLIPGMIGHTILDVLDYSFWWTNMMGKSERPTIFESGLDAHFILVAFLFISSVWAIFFGFKKLRKINSGTNIRIRVSGAGK